MKIFLSWSKRLSEQYAQAFREWLPNVIQSVEPFISSQDIGLGERGIDKIESHLSSISFGVLFVTRENAREPWLLYEAGALSRSIDAADARLIPILIDIDRSELAGSPISHFQNAQTSSEETFRKLCTSINEVSADPLPQDRFERSFTKWWPDLKEAFDGITVPQSVDQEVTLESVSDAIADLGQEFVRLRNNESRQSAMIETLLNQATSGEKRRMLGMDARPSLGAFRPHDLNNSPPNSLMEDAKRLEIERLLKGELTKLQNGGQSDSTE